MTITREQLAAEAPDVLAAVQAEGASAERARIQAVEGQLIPGHEALISTMKFDGKSGPGDAAMAVNAAEKQTRQAYATALANDAPKALPGAAAPTVTPAAPSFGAVGAIDASTDVTALNAAAKTYQAAHPGTPYIAAVKAVQQGA